LKGISTESVFGVIDIKEGDALKMKGSFGPYDHYVVVLSKDQSNNTVTVLESSLRQDEWIYLILKTLLLGTLQDPQAALAQVQKTSYTIDKLKHRQAKKIVFPEKLQKYINKDKTLKNAEKEMEKQDLLYGLSLNNCENLVYRCLFDVNVSCQAEEKWWLFQAISIAFQMISGVCMYNICPAPMSAVFYGLMLAIYQSFKLRLQKDNHISYAQYENEQCMICIKCLFFFFVFFFLYTF